MVMVVASSRQFMWQHVVLISDGRGGMGGDDISNSAVAMAVAASLGGK